MKIEASKLLENYDHTYKHDIELLTSSNSLTFNTRNALLMRAGEKKILNKIVKFTDTMLDYFKLDFNE
jgi:hypothetical protein